MTAPDPIRPVPCPRCGEAQNMTPGNFDPAREPFGPVTCMACGHDFSRDEYRAGLIDRLADDDGGDGD